MSTYFYAHEHKTTHHAEHAVVALWIIKQMAAQPKKKSRTTVDPSGPGAAALGTLATDFGVSRKYVVERLALFASGQDEAIQAIMLDLVPRRFRPDLARLMLSKLADFPSRPAEESDEGPGTAASREELRKAQEDERRRIAEQKEKGRGAGSG
jgi:hypothetical protein